MSGDGGNGASHSFGSGRTRSRCTSYRQSWASTKSLNGWSAEVSVQWFDHHVTHGAGGILVTLVSLLLVVALARFLYVRKIFLRV